MSLLVGVVVILLVFNESAQAGRSILPDTYKDVFIPGMGKKPLHGTSSSTCWARGGICVDIMQCPHLNMDIAVAGCSWGYKVCCKVHRMLPPTVGAIRRAHLPIIRSPEDLGTMLMNIAQENSLALSKIGGWDQDKTEEEKDY